MTPDQILDALDPEQREAALAVRGPVCILAGAGTGKTRTITHRIAYAVASGAIPEQHALAVTFTARAAGEMRARLRALGVPGATAMTFHAAALRQLRHFWPRLVGGEMPELTASKFRLVAGTLRGAAAELVRDVVAEIEWARTTVVSPARYPAAARRAGRTPPLPDEQIVQAYTHYEEAKRRSNVLDFEDLLLLMAAGIEEHDDIAGEVRARYRHITVDEYQDVSPLQQQLLDAWLGERDDLCVVGDPRQTIYTFAGASDAYLLRFARRHPGTVVVRLHRDYRSTPQVVGLANALVRAGEPLTGQRPAGPEPVVYDCDSEPEEARWVADQVERLRDAGGALDEIAVLYRINAQSENYEAALAARGIAYVVRGERFFERREVRDALRALSEAAARGGVRPLDVLRERLGYDPDAPPAGGAARERWEAWRALADLAVPYGDDLAGFVAELTQRAADQHAPSTSGVTLATLHAAKGLEWDAVFLVGLVDGTVPIQHAKTPDAIAEERRLLYVGVTRAREHLFLSYARARQEGGRRSRRPSRFLANVTPKQPKRAAAARPVVPDDPLFSALRSWRTQRAGELAKPAYVVFSDATLREIAARTPRTLDQLAAVSGVGPAKLSAYGEEVLRLVASTSA